VRPQPSGIGSSPSLDTETTAQADSRLRRADGTPVDITAIQPPRQFEEFLRDAGFTKSLARSITAHGFKLASSAELGERTGRAQELLAQLRIARVGISEG